MNEFIHPDVDREYKRWLALVGDDMYSGRTNDALGMHDVLRAHFLIVDYFSEQESGIGGAGPKSINTLHSAIYRQFVSFRGKEKWPGQYEKCATLLFGLIKDHPFHDGNKRTALLSCLYQLNNMKRTPTINQKALEDFMVEIADNRLRKYARYKSLAESEDDAEVQFIADFLKRNTRTIDNTKYTVTYHRLKQMLERHGFTLEKPEGNYIGVYRVELTRKYFGLGKEEIKRTRVAQINFPGWKNQVGKGTIKQVREKTELTAAFGCDSAVFYQEADPLHSLIDIYSGPLRRLANR